MVRLYEIFAELKIKPNLTQNAAISILICVDDLHEKIEKLALEASRLFDVQVEKGLTLLTIRHYRKELLEKLILGRKIVLQQWSPETVQTLMY